MRRAFTFIEILATLTFMSIVLPAIMQGITLSLAAAQFAKQQSQASALAHGKMMELVALNKWDDPVLSGDFSPEQPQYRWTAELSDWDGVSLEQLDVTVVWLCRGQQRSVSFSTLVNNTTAAQDFEAGIASAGGTP